jgi:polyhydroxybutyrate depolymerase
MMINGTADPLVPFNGGQTGWYSVPQTISFWTAKNSCTLPPDTVTMPDLDPNDNLKVLQYTYRSSNGAPVVRSLKIVGGGHTWPGAPELTSELGATTNDIQANAEIWNFFEQCKKGIDAVE